MSNNWKLTLVLFSIAIGLGSTWMVVASRRHQQRHTAAMALLRDMDRVDQRLTQASVEFGIALQQFLVSGAAQELAVGEDGERGNDTTSLGSETPHGDDLEVVQQSHRTLMETVSQSIAVVSRLEAPASEHGAALIAAERKYLLVQRRIIREDFSELLRLLEGTPLPASAGHTSLESIVDAAYVETRREFASVTAARKKFAEEFEIQLTSQR